MKALKISIAVTCVSTIISAITAYALIAFSSFSLGPIILEWLFLEGALLYGVFERRAAVFGRIFWKAPRGLNAIAITFDDGPNEPYTSQILDILKEFGVHATFFLIGENVRRFPEVVRREVEEGHEIGNHTYDHQVLPLKSAAYIRKQVRLTSNLVKNVSGVKPRLFRAPHGWRNPWLNWAVRQEGCIPVAWTLGVWDTDRPGEEVILQRSLKGLRKGTILLLHDGRGTEQGTDSSQLVKTLPAILNAAQERGYALMTVSELIGKQR